MSTLPDKITTRTFRKADAAAVAQMMRTLAVCHGDTSLAKPELFLKHALGPARVSHIWVAQAQGRCVGFIEGTFAVNYPMAEKVMRINFIHVDEAFRKQGIGLALLRRATAAALEQGCRRINLDALKSNRAAQAFYKKCGMNVRADVPLARYKADLKLMKNLAGPKGKRIEKDKKR